MKTTITFSFLAVLFTFSSLQSVHARDLTYKLGVGYRQASIMEVDDKTQAQHELQLNGLEATYGVARDFQAGAYLGFDRNFDFCAMGPTIRYNVQRLLNQDAAVWTYV